MKCILQTENLSKTLYYFWTDLPKFQTRTYIFAFPSHPLSDVLKLGLALPLHFNVALVYTSMT